MEGKNQKIFRAILAQCLRLVSSLWLLSGVRPSPRLLTLISRSASSADFQSAISQGFQPAGLAILHKRSEMPVALPIGNRRYRSLEDFSFGYSWSFSCFSLRVEFDLQAAPHGGAACFMCDYAHKPVDGQVKVGQNSNPRSQPVTRKNRKRMTANFFETSRQR